MQRILMVTVLSVAVVTPALARNKSHHHYRHQTARDGQAGWQSEWSGGMASADRSWRGGGMRRQTTFGANGLDAMIASHAAANGVPLDLARRVVARESGGNVRAVSKGNYGLMQIRHGTARAMGYTGSAAGLLDPQTNLTYAMKYLAGAYRAAGGNPDRAVSLYARGYYYEAKRQGWSPYQNQGFGRSGGGYDAYAWAQPSGTRRANTNGRKQQNWSGWNQNHTWYAGRPHRHDRRFAWNDPSWGSWRNSGDWNNGDLPRRRVHKKRS
jgi:soluble lytic murein transglycosylase-like protein